MIEQTISYLSQTYLAGDIDDDTTLTRLRGMGMFEEEARAVLGCFQDDALHLRMTRLLDGMGDAA